jgi:metal-responsive CopG/Arc/MetJ family transcriptional regulator
MKSLLVQLDEPTYRALNRIAPAAKRQRAEFVRSAIRKAIRETEEQRTRRAYLEKPKPPIGPPPRNGSREAA